MHTNRVDLASTGKPLHHVKFIILNIHEVVNVCNSYFNRIYLAYI